MSLCSCLAVSKPINDQPAMSAVGFASGDIRLYNDASHQIFHTLKEHPSIVHCMAFSLHDGGKMLASVSHDKLLLWDTTTHLCLHKFAQETYLMVDVLSISFSSGGNLLVSGDADGFITVWNMPERTLNIKWRTEVSAVLCIASSADNELIASAQESGDFMIYGMKSSMIHNRKVNTVNGLNSAAFSQDCRLLATVESKQPLKLWNTDGNHMLLMQFDYIVYNMSSVKFSPDDKHLITSVRDNQIFTWDVRNSLPVKHFRTKKSLFDSHFHPNGKQIVSVSVEDGLHIWAACEWDDRVCHRFFSAGFKKRVFFLMCVKMHQEMHHAAVQLPMQLWLNIFGYLSVLCE
jgi:WD40 repeat protein